MLLRMEKISEARALAPRYQWNWLRLGALALNFVLWGLIYEGLCLMGVL
jgi:hypothetical protein